MSAKSLTQTDLVESDELLRQLLAEVEGEETPLSGGRTATPGTDALRHLRATTIKFGDPLDHLRRLKLEDFDSLGIPVTNMYRDQIKDHFDFYALTLNLLLQPGAGVQFHEIELWLGFGPEKVRPIVQSLSPESEWNEILQWGGGLRLQIDADLGLQLGVPSKISAVIPVNVRHLAADTDNNAFVVVNDYRFALGRAGIVATGKGGDFCFWRVTKPELKQTQTVTFAVIFKVLKGTTNIDLTAVAVAYPSFEWLTQQLRHVLSELKARLRDLFLSTESERPESNRLPRGCIERWHLTLR